MLVWIIDISFAVPKWVYIVSSTPETWENARDDCLKRKGDLVSIQDEYEQSILDLLTQPPAFKELHFWTGLQHKGKGYLWSDKSALNYTGWAKREPNNYLNQKNCTKMHKQLRYYYIFVGLRSQRKSYWSSLEWYSSDCKTAYNYICKVPDSKSKILNIVYFWF